MKKAYYILLTLATLFLYTGCANLLAPKTGIIRFASNQSRAAAETTVNGLTDIVLTGTHNGNTVELGRWNKYSDLSSVAIEIETGKWDFTLEAVAQTKNYEGKISNFIISAGDNVLSFVLDWLNPYTECTINKLGDVYNTFSSKPGMRGKTLTIKLTESVTKTTEWNSVKTALSKVKNNVYVALILNLTNFNCTLDDSKKNTPEVLSEITILQETTGIGDFIFYDCPNLRKLTLPAITNFGKQTFDKCENLTYIDYKGTLEQWCGFDHYTPRVHPQAYQNKVQDYTLIIDGNEITTNVNLPSTVKNYGIGIFKNCSKLKTVNIPEGTTGLGKHMFANCRNLNNVTIPASVTVIPEEIFYQCNSLDNLIFEKSENITDIGFCSLSYTGLKEFKFPEKIKTIQGGVLKHCENLSKVTLPEGTTTINKDAFLNCTNLTELKIPDSVTKIGKCFVQDSGVTKLEFPKSLIEPADGKWPNKGWTYTLGSETKAVPKDILTNPANFTTGTYKDAELNKKK